MGNAKGAKNWVCTEGVWPVAHCIPKERGCFDCTGPQFATTIHIVKLHSLTTNQLKALPHIFDVGDVLWMLGQTKTSKRCENRKAIQTSRIPMNSIYSSSIEFQSMFQKSYSAWLWDCWTTQAGGHQGHQGHQVLSGCPGPKDFTQQEK